MNASPIADAWDRMVALGYLERLIPIVPPNAPLSERSTLHHRLTAGEDARGKAPGVKGRDGLWHSFGWRAHQTTAEDVARWRAMGAGIGVRTGDGLAAIDADTLDPALARTIKEAIEAALGEPPIRIGQYPKALYLVRIEPPDHPYAKLVFQMGGRERIEVLTGGRQFVASGIHPKTREPYRWAPGRGPLPMAQLPVLTAEALGNLLARLRPLLPAPGDIEREGAAGAGSPVDQAALKGDPELIRAAVAALPNDNEHFATRESYLGVGYAIKAALAGDGDDTEAFSIFSEWCERWSGGINEKEIVSADWRRMKPPFRRGAGWLIDLAEAASGGAFRGRALEWFEPPAAEPEYVSIFGADEPPAAPSLAAVLGSEILESEPQEQRWIVKDLIPAEQVTMLSGDGGTGKSLAALQLGAACSSEGLWLGESVAPGSCLFVTAEDDLEELHRRLARIATADGINKRRLDRLALVSLWGQDAVMAAEDSKTKLLRKTEMFGRVERAIAERRPLLTVLDTQADLFGGDENKRPHARQFVGFLQGLVRRHHTTILLLAHPSVAGMRSGTGTGGSTAWSNSVRSRLYLERVLVKTGNGEEVDEPDPDARTLTNKKNNRSRIGRALRLRYAEGRFTALISAADEPTESQAADDAKFLKLLAKFKAAGRSVTDGKTTARYAPTAFAAFDKTTKADAMRAAMERLFATERIVLAPLGKPSDRQKQIVINSLEESLF